MDEELEQLVQLIAEQKRNQAGGDMSFMQPPPGVTAPGMKGEAEEQAYRRRLYSGASPPQYTGNADVDRETFWNYEPELGPLSKSGRSPADYAGRMATKEFVDYHGYDELPGQMTDPDDTFGRNVQHGAHENRPLRQRYRYEPPEWTKRRLQILGE